MSMFVLYRFFDSDDVLLYVGLTINPGERFKKHRAEKPWWTEIANIAIEHHETLDALKAAEREWQGHVIDRDGDRFIVELFSWWDGMPNGQKIVTVEQMQTWRFYDTAIEMQIADGCPEMDPDTCGCEVTHYIDQRHWGGGIHWLCRGCVERYPGFKKAKKLRWNRFGKPVLL